LVGRIKILAIVITITILSISILGYYHYNKPTTDDEDETSNEEETPLLSGKITYVLNASGNAKQKITIASDTTATITYLANESESERAIVAIVPEESAPLKYETIPCFLHFEMIEVFPFYYSSFEDNAMEGQISLQPGNYSVLISADKPGWGMTIYVGGSGEETIGLAPNKDVDYDIQAFDQEESSDLTTTTLFLDHSKSVEGKALCFRKTVITDDGGFVTVERNSLTFQTVAPDGTVFYESEYGYVHRGISSYSSGSKVFLIGLDVANAGSGEWQFEATYTSEGWNLQWDIEMYELELSY